MAGELQKLEWHARERQIAGGESYSRLSLARASEVSERVLDTWFDGSHIPRNIDQLMRTVNTLAVWAGQGPPPPRSEWVELCDAARQGTPEVGGSRQVGGDGSAKGPWWRKPVVWILGIVASASAAVLTGWLNTGVHDLTAIRHKSPQMPFEWTIARSDGMLNSCEGWHFPVPIGKIPVRRFGDSNADEQWALRNHGTDIDNSAWTITLQGRTSKSVVIQDIRVKIIGKRLAPRGTQIASDMGCGGVITVRYFSVALDSANLRLTAEGQARSWPYSISRTGVEEVRLEAYIENYKSKYEYLYVYEIDWAQGDRRGTAEIRAPNGQPFVLTPGLLNSPTYFIDNGRWKSNNCGSSC